MRCLFVSDLHGQEPRYRKLIAKIREEIPRAVFIGGDLLPGLCSMESRGDDLFGNLLIPELVSLKKTLADRYPRIFVILGNDDPRACEELMQDGETQGIWEYVHDRSVQMEEFEVFGYAYIPPSPFLLKDWERYDVSRYIDPGCVSPEEGYRSVPVPPHVTRCSTIAEDLEKIAVHRKMERSIFLFHSPPYRTNLDRAALDGKTIDHVPLDVNLGSIAIRRFIEQRQPLLTLHGHIHESAAITGSWRDRIGRTHLLSAAHDGSELAIVRFDLRCLDKASRELV